MSKVYIIHENPAWTAPLHQRLTELGTPFEDWDLSEGVVDIDAVPPVGVFYNRMSASSYTRDHRFAPEYAAVVLSWLDAHGRRLVNGPSALSLEINKAAQYQVLKRHSVPTPRSVVAMGRDQIKAAAAKYFPTGPFILKPNRGGKGDGVQLFESVAALSAHLDDPAYTAPADEISMLQQYVASPDNSIIRAEFIGGELFYSVRVETGGAFELCPADVCQIPEAPSGPRFEILTAGDGVPQTLLDGVGRALKAAEVDVAGVEFIRDADGQWYAYDINTNTNYNADAETTAGLFGMRQLATFLTDELAAARSDVTGWKKAS